MDMSHGLAYLASNWHGSRRMSVSDSEYDLVLEHRLRHEKENEINSLKAAKETLLQQIAAIEARLVNLVQDTKP